MLIDTHAHINDERLLPRAAEIHESMPEKGIESLIVVGYERPSSESAVELSLKYPRFYAAVGIHPHDSKTASAEKRIHAVWISSCSSLHPQSSRLGLACSSA